MAISLSHVGHCCFFSPAVCYCFSACTDMLDLRSQWYTSHTRVVLLV
jgi:hypothetical protein